MHIEVLRISPGDDLRGALVLALLPGWQFSRQLDTATGFAELVVGRVDGKTP